jgi:hypothetical protein
MTNTARPGPSLHRTSARDCTQRSLTIHMAQASPHSPGRRHGPPPHQTPTSRSRPSGVLAPTSAPHSAQPGHPRTPAWSHLAAAPAWPPPTPARSNPTGNSRLLPRSTAPPQAPHTTAAQIGPRTPRTAGRRLLLRHGRASTARSAQPHHPAAAADGTPGPPPWLPPSPPATPHTGRPPRRERARASLTPFGDEARRHRGKGRRQRRRRSVAGGAGRVWLPASPGERCEEPLAS